MIDMRGGYSKSSEPKCIAESAFAQELPLNIHNTTE